MSNNNNAELLSSPRPKRAYTPSPSSFIGSSGGHSKRQRREPRAGLDGIQEDLQMDFGAALQVDMASLHAAQASTPAPRASRGDESVTSDVSNWSHITEAPATTPELFHRYLQAGSGSTLVTNPGETIESSWIDHCAQTGFEPSNLDIRNAIHEMLQNPRSSAILQMGRRSSEANLQILLDLETNSQTRARKANDKATEAFAQRELCQGPMERAREAYFEAKETLQNWERKKQMAIAFQQHQESLHAEHHRRGKVCRGLIAMLRAILEDGNLQIFSNVPMAQVRERLGLTDPSECFLFTSNECLSVLHIMDICGHVVNQEFIRLWTFPTEGYANARESWDEHGTNPQIKTGNATVHKLRTRVCNYLAWKGPVPPRTVDGTSSVAELRAAHNYLVELLQGAEEEDLFDLEDDEAPLADAAVGDESAAGDGDESAAGGGDESAAGDGN